MHGTTLYTDMTKASFGRMWDVVHGAETGDEVEGRCCGEHEVDR